MPRDPGIADYMPPDKGPFLCGHCEYANRRGRFGLECVKPPAISDILEHFPARRLPNGRARIELGGCCDYYWPVSR